MTRINSAIFPVFLTDEHLLAEHREIKRIPTLFAKGTYHPSKIPPKFTLGKGHVLYFLDKPEFTFNRYNVIREECLRRGFNVEDYSSNWDSYAGFKGNKHINTYEEEILLRTRIIIRISESPKKCWHYQGQRISKEEAINLINIEELKREPIKELLSLHYK